MTIGGHPFRQFSVFADVRAHPATSLFDGDMSIFDPKATSAG
jgi:hypothetical protein